MRRFGVTTELATPPERVWQVMHYRTLCRIRGNWPAHVLRCTAAVLLAISSAAVTAAHTQTRPVDDVMRALLFWFDMPDAERTIEFTEEVRQSLDAYRMRVQRFNPSFTLTVVPESPEHSMQLKRIALQRALFGLFDAPEIPAIAADYSRRARLYYEWEGFADAPLGEASFADEFLRRHPNSPIVPYLNLFAGHRKLCAASGLEGLEPSSEKGRRTAQEGVAQLHLARDAGHPLIRLVAERVLATRRCFEDR